MDEGRCLHCELCLVVVFAMPIRVSVTIEFRQIIVARVWLGDGGLVAANIADANIVALHFF